MSVPNLNNVTLVGRVVEEPELRSTTSGLAVCELRLAVTDLPEKATLYVDVATFGDAAETCHREVSRGSDVAVSGRLVYREWETKNGTKRSKHSVVGKVLYRDGDHVPAADGDDA